MSRFLPLGWLQLKHQKLRLLAAIIGIAFAVILITVQLEFSQALSVSAVRYHSAMDYELVMVSPKTTYLVSTKQFPRGRLYQATGFKGVSAVTPVYTQQGSWRNPADRTSARNIFVVGFNPSDRGFARLLTPDQHDLVKLPDRIIFDQRGRPEYGPVAALFESNGSYEVDINDRMPILAGLYSLGTSFGLDGGVITSDLNFLRAFPKRDKSAIDIGLIHLEPGADPVQLQREIVAAIPGDVRVLTREEFKAQEINHWSKTTPVGYMFTFGAIMGLVVGFIIVYQILFADVQDHTGEYATLKAMGYTHGYLRGVVLQQSLVLAVLGFIPGITISILVFGKAADATGLPLSMDARSAGFLFLLTLLMCAGSGILALRKLRSIDPAEVF
ncbi:MAG: ABC transporter permease DevC [Haliea sp.]|uniref:ABC transporter permease DevC n=1 Tax=Haliea sp. TaxID=1932666 RepID=UPI0032EB5333